MPARLHHMGTAASWNRQHQANVFNVKDRYMSKIVPKDVMQAWMIDEKFFKWLCTHNLEEDFKHSHEPRTKNEEALYQKEEALKRRYDVNNPVIGQTYENVEVDDMDVAMNNEIDELADVPSGDPQGANNEVFPSKTSESKTESDLKLPNSLDDSKKEHTASSSDDEQAPTDDHPRKDRTLSEILDSAPPVIREYRMSNIDEILASAASRSSKPKLESLVRPGSPLLEAPEPPGDIELTEATLIPGAVINDEEKRQTTTVKIAGDDNEQVDSSGVTSTLEAVADSIPPEELSPQQANQMLRDRNPHKVKHRHMRDRESSVATSVGGKLDKLKNNMLKQVMEPTTGLERVSTYRTGANHAQIDADVANILEEMKGCDTLERTLRFKRRMEMYYDWDSYLRGPTQTEEQGDTPAPFMSKEQLKNTLMGRTIRTILFSHAEQCVKYFHLLIAIDAPFSHKLALEYATSREEEFNTRPALLKLISFFCVSVDPTFAIKTIDDLLSRRDVPASVVIRWGLHIVNHAHFPVNAALQLAGVVYRHSGLLDSHDTTENLKYVAASRFFGRWAEDMLYHVQSDHVVYLMLYQRDYSGKCAFDIAVETRNVSFCGDERVVKIQDALYSIPSVLNRAAIPSKPGTYTEMLKLLLFDPQKFFLLPMAKFTIRVTSYFIYLVLMTCTIVYVHENPAYHKQFSGFEIMGYVAVGAYAFQEFEDFFSSTVEMKFKGWKKFDMLIYLLWVVVFGFRVTSFLSAKEPDDRTPVGTGYVVALGIVAGLSWVRFSYFLTVNPTIGPLLRMIMRMTLDVYNFAWLMMVLLVAFAVTMYTLSSQINMELYSTLPTSVFVTFQQFMSIWSHDLGYDFNEIDCELSSSSLGSTDNCHSYENHQIERHVMTFILSCYAFLSLVVLLNILIAMVSDTYFKVNESSKDEFLFGRAAIRHQMEQENADLPPPLSIILFFLHVLYWIFTLLKNLVIGLFTCSRPKWPFAVDPDDPSTADEEGDWVCMFCHQINSELPLEHCKTYVRNWIHLTEQRKRTKDAQSRATMREVTAIKDLEFTHEEVELCLKCHRVRYEISIYQVVRSRVAFVVFMICIYIPILLVSIVPFALMKMREVCTTCQKSSDESYEENYSIASSTYSFKHKSTTRKKADRKHPYTYLSKLKPGQSLSADETMPQTHLQAVIRKSIIMLLTRASHDGEIPEEYALNAMGNFTEDVQSEQQQDQDAQKRKKMKNNAVHQSNKHSALGRSNVRHH